MSGPLTGQVFDVWTQSVQQFEPKLLVRLLMCGFNFLVRCRFNLRSIACCGARRCLATWNWKVGNYIIILIMCDLIYYRYPARQGSHGVYSSIRASALISS